MDKIDIQLLYKLETNSRISLKDLAQELNIKTSTIYHRLHKLKESKILDKFTISINPDELGLKSHVLITIRMKKTVIGKLDLMFIESYAKYLGEQFTEIIFSSVGDDEQIWSVATFPTEEELHHFEQNLKENTYIESFSIIQLNKVMKGLKLFPLIPKMFHEINKDEFFDDAETSMNTSHEIEKKKEKNDESEKKDTVFF